MIDLPASIRDAYDEGCENTARYVVGGVLTAADRAVIRKRVAQALGVTPQTVAEALDRRDTHELEGASHEA